MYAQTKPLEYQSMYVPKSQQQLWNETIMVSNIIDNTIQNAKLAYKNQQFMSAINACKEAQKYGKKYFGRIEIETFYIMGKSYAQLNKNKKAKKHLKKARKYGIYMDSQVF